MKKSKNLMFFSLKILSILAFGLLITPTQTLAIAGYNAEYFITNIPVSVGSNSTISGINYNFFGTKQTGSATNPSNNNSNANNNANKNSGNLAATAIFGSTGNFLPSGLFQWIWLAIIVFILVTLTRRTFGARKKYVESPMKHA